MTAIPRAGDRCPLCRLGVLVEHAGLLLCSASIEGRGCRVQPAGRRRWA